MSDIDFNNVIEISMIKDIILKSDCNYKLKLIHYLDEMIAIINKEKIIFVDYLDGSDSDDELTTEEEKEDDEDWD
jgi:hypothetical protein|tara:strand:- start:829 stop:1053 length:225 start_codon:yes stop_codon:yes gene_type:complete